MASFSVSGDFHPPNPVLKRDPNKNSGYVTDYSKYSWRYIDKDSLDFCNAYVKQKKEFINLHLFRLH